MKIYNNKIMTKNINMIKNVLYILMICVFFTACSRDEDFSTNGDDSHIVFDLTSMTSSLNQQGDQAANDIRIYIFKTGTNILVDYVYYAKASFPTATIELKALGTEFGFLQEMDVIALVNFGDETEPNFVKATDRSILEAGVWDWVDLDPDSPMPRVLIKREITSDDGTDINPLELKIPAILSKVDIYIAKEQNNTNAVYIEDISIGQLPSKMYYLPRQAASYPENTLMNNNTCSKSYIMPEADVPHSGLLVTQNLTTSSSTNNSDFQYLTTCYVPEHITGFVQDPYVITINYKIVVNQDADDALVVQRSNRLTLLEGGLPIAIRNNQIDVRYTVGGIDADATQSFGISINTLIEADKITIPDFE